MAFQNNYDWMQWFSVEKEKKRNKKKRKNKCDYKQLQSNCVPSAFC